jgi:hypothetical protein
LKVIGYLKDGDRDGFEGKKHWRSKNMWKQLKAARQTRKTMNNVPMIPPSVQAAKYSGENSSILLFGLIASGAFFFN